jgi:hypothetical protein
MDAHLTVPGRHYFEIHIFVDVDDKGVPGAALS